MEMQKENKNETNEGEENELVGDAEVAEAKCAGVGMEGPQKKQSSKSDKKGANKSEENMAEKTERKQARRSPMQLGEMQERKGIVLQVVPE